LIILLCYPLGSFRDFIEFLGDIGQIDANLAQLNTDKLTRWSKSLAKEIGKRKVKKRVEDDGIYSFIFG
jgi:hypothetical protein